MSSKGYKKVGTLGGARHGDAYQVHVLMLLYEKAAADDEYVDFRLATEMEAAGKFDDAVLSWKCNRSGVKNWLFVQVKHKPSAKLTELHLFPVAEEEKSKGDFSMYKYLNSYWDIKHNCAFEGDKQFVIYSNGGLGDKIQNWFSDGAVDARSVLKLPPQMGQLLKLRATDDHVQQLWKYGNRDFNELADTIKSIFVKGETSFKGNLFKKYRGALNSKVLVVDKTVVRFTPRFIKKVKLNYMEQQLRQHLFTDDNTYEQMTSFSIANEEIMNILSSKGDSCNTLPPSIEMKEVIEFINQLIFAVSQPSNADLEVIIKDDLRHLSPMKDPESSECYTLWLYTTLQKMIHGWLDDKDGSYLGKAELMEQFRSVYQTIANSKLDVYTIHFQAGMEGLGVGFNDIKLPFGNQFPMAIVTSTKQGLLTNLKVYQALQNNHYRYFSLKDLQVASIRTELCDAVGKKNANFHLILKDDCAKFEFSAQILNAMPPCNQIKLILLTCSGHCATTFFNDHPFTLLHDGDNSFNRLDLRSQHMLLERTVIFQGIELPLSKLPGYEVFREEILEQLIEGDTIELGSDLPELKLKHYIPRTISCCDSGESTADSDSTEPDFDEGQNDSAENSNYSEEQFLEDIPIIFTSSRVVVLSSTPGMGKTTLWTSLALLAKKLEKSKWIFHIKLVDCVNELQTLKKIDDLKDATEFMLNATQLKSKFERLLFSHCLQEIPNCTYIFFDGFDEIPYETTGRAISLFRILQETTRVFVNTRTHQQVEVEQALGVDAFFLQPISKRDQKTLFISFYDFSSSEQSSFGPLTGFVEQLIDKIHSKSMEIASNVVGVPLVLNMLAEVYKPYIQSFRATGNPGIFQAVKLDTLNILDLFELFVYSSFKRQNIEKLNLDETNIHVQHMLEQSHFFYKGFVTLHSFLGLVSLVKQNKMNLIIRNKRELSMLQTQANAVESAIVTRFIRGIAYFIHASIAEFFAAKCLFEYLSRMSTKQVEQNFVKNDPKKNAPKKRYVKDLFDLYHKVLRDYPTVRKFFFLMAQQDGDCVEKLVLLLSCMRPYPLLWASEEGFEVLARLLIEEDPSIVDSRPKNKITALHIAAAKGYHNMCALLINSKLDVNAKNIQKQSALHIAALNGYHEVASLLISRRAIVDVVDCRLQTPLHVAAQGGHTKVVRLLTKNGCDVNILSKRGWNALHIAAFNGHTDVARILLAKKIQLKVGGAKNWLMFVGYLVSHEFRELVAMLVEYEVKTSIRNTDIVPTLFWAVKRDHVSILRALHKAGVNIHSIDEKSGQCSYRVALSKRSFKAAKVILQSQNSLDLFEYPLHAAAEAGSVECVSILLSGDGKAEVNAINENGVTPLDLALKQGHLDIVQMLLNKSAIPNNCALHAVVKSDLSEIKIAQLINTLLTYGAGVNVVDKSGCTPLHLAAMKDSDMCIRVLFNHGASATSKDTAGRTPLHLAVAHNSTRVIFNLVVDRKSLVTNIDEHLVDAQDKKGRAALHEACGKGFLASVLELIGVGADVNSVNNKQQTPMHLAAMGGHWHIIPVLINASADICAVDLLGMSHLDYAASNGHCEYVDRFLMLRPAIIQRFDLDKARNLAIQHGHDELAKKLGFGATSPISEVGGSSIQI